MTTTTAGVLGALLGATLWAALTLSLAVASHGVAQLSRRASALRSSVRQALLGRLETWHRRRELLDALQSGPVDAVWFQPGDADAIGAVWAYDVNGRRVAVSPDRLAREYGDKPYNLPEPAAKWRGRWS